VKKVFYCTENYWAFQNLAELNRLKAFQQRTGIWVRPERQTRVSFSDEYADYITLLGTSFQQLLYNARPERYQLDISVAVVPEQLPKHVASARANFLWMGSGGVLLKGLDLAVEAFLELPKANLYIAGAIEREPRVWKWLKPILDKHPNIHYLGWVDVATSTFAKLANNCIGVVYPSASEGGGGVVAQLLHFGLVPIVTQTATVRAASLGFEIESQEPAIIIDAIRLSVRTVLAMPEHELTQRSAAVQAFAAAHHTRPAYATSFAALLDRMVL
jgi:glycosyltransferase involved in cell wall biosynthesis